MGFGFGASLAEPIWAARTHKDLLLGGMIREAHRNDLHRESLRVAREARILRKRLDVREEILRTRSEELKELGALELTPEKLAKLSPDNFDLAVGGLDVAYLLLRTRHGWIAAPRDEPLVKFAPEATRLDTMHGFSYELLENQGADHEQGYFRLLDGRFLLVTKSKNRGEDRTVTVPSLPRPALP